MSLTLIPRPLSALLVGAFVLRVVFVFVTPAWQSPDEFPHYWVASSIALGHGYPAGSQEFPGYEAYQAPLYYGLLAGVMIVSGLPPLEYSEEPEGPPLSLVILRLLSVVLGISAVGATWSVGRAMFPDVPTVPFFAAAFTTVLPTFVGLSASLNNDVLVVSLSSLFLVVILRPYSRWSGKSCLVAGFLAGAAIATKLTGVLLLLVLGYRLLEVRAGSRARVWRSVPMLLPGLVLGVGALVMRNLLVYGAPLVITPGAEMGLTMTVSQFLRALRNIGWSFWLAFGRTYEIHLPPLAYVLLAGFLTGAALFGWWRCRKDPAVKSNAALMAAVLCLGVIASLGFTLSYPAGMQTSWGKNLYPLLPLFAVFAGFGWTAAFPRHPRVTPWLAVGLLVSGSMWGIYKLAS
jgi:hypothetical protein